FCQDSDSSACDLKFDRLTHADLHFVFPIAANAKVKSKPTSALFLGDWRIFVEKNPAGTLFDWYQQIEIENKQGQIGVLDAEEITKKLSLKSYEGGWKGVIVWQADKLNNAAANKLLKLIEEPPEKTLLMFISNHEDRVLETLRSRCQLINFSLLADADIYEALVANGASQEQAKTLSVHSNGQLSRAMHVMNADDVPFEEWFVNWVRTAFKAKQNKGSVVELLNWSQKIAQVGRETQKQFLLFSIDLFRQALLIQYDLDELSTYKPQNSFDLNRFAKYVHNGNIHLIISELESACIHIERNGNAKMIFSDLSLKLTRQIHKAPILAP
ncbi:MAG: DNA polymerase III subunit delta', partial [Bacteroidota bacterium]|nr:DNA polymerase III subunit delta' [Bacteroidota bacterium]